MSLVTHSSETDIILPRELFDTLLRPRTRAYSISALPNLWLGGANRTATSHE